MLHHCSCSCWTHTWCKLPRLTFPLCGGAVEPQETTRTGLHPTNCTAKTKPDPGEGLKVMEIRDGYTMTNPTPCALRFRKLKSYELFRCSCSFQNSAASATATCAQSPKVVEPTLLQVNHNPLALNRTDIRYRSHRIPNSWSQGPQRPSPNA